MTEKTRIGERENDKGIDLIQSAILSRLGFYYEKTDRSFFKKNMKAE